MGRIIRRNKIAIIILLISCPKICLTQSFPVVPNGTFALHSECKRKENFTMSKKSNNNEGINSNSNNAITDRLLSSMSVSSRERPRLKPKKSMDIESHCAEVYGCGSDEDDYDYKNENNNNKSSNNNN